MTLRYVVMILALAGCSRGAKVKVVHPAQAPVETTVSTITSGTIDAVQQAVLGFGATGRVAKITTRLGDTVKRGQVLAELENDDLRASFTDTQTEVQRAEELFKEGLVAKAALDDAKRAYETAKSGYERSVLRAPFDGIVAEMNLQLGELSTANPSKAPVRVVDSKPRIVKGEIDEVDMAKVKPGAPARIKVLAVRSAPFKAQVTKVIPYVGTTREQDRSSQIELGFTETTDFVPVGASADIEIITEAKDKALAVPARSVLGSGKNRYVFRVVDDKLAKTPIEIGIGNYDHLEILKGLTEKDLVALPADDVEFADGKRVKTETIAWP